MQSDSSGAHVQDEVAELLRQQVQLLDPYHLEIHNFSHQHSKGENTHYRLVLVSKQFIEKNKVKRHQMLYKAAARLMPDPIHALVLDLYTPTEWQNTNGKRTDLPTCRGKGD